MARLPACAFVARQSNLYQGTYAIATRCRMPCVRVLARSAVVYLNTFHVSWSQGNFNFSACVGAAACRFCTSWR